MLQKLDKIAEIAYKHQLIPHKNSNAVSSLPRQLEADIAYREMQKLSWQQSTSIVGFPWATAPTRNTIGSLKSFSFMKSWIFISLPWVERASLRLSGGKWLVTGLVTIFSKVSLDSSARMDIFLSSWAIRDENLLNVLGIRVAELILMTWLDEVVTYTSNLPALLRGESRSVSRHW